jgi:hypothetical protein
MPSQRARARRPSRSNDEAPPLRVFLGIFTRAAQYEHRALMRATMLGVPGPEALHASSPLAGLRVTHRFVVCGARGDSTRNATANEQDVLLLRISNNGPGGACGRNRGSVELIQLIDSVWPGAFDWVLKTDYDAYVNLSPQPIDPIPSQLIPLSSHPVGTWCSPTCCVCCAHCRALTGTSASIA